MAYIKSNRESLVGKVNTLDTITNLTRLSKSRTSISIFDGRRRYFLWIVQFRLERIRNCSTGAAGDRTIRSKRTRPRTNSQSQFGPEKAGFHRRYHGSQAQTAAVR